MLRNLYDAAKGCLYMDVQELDASGTGRIVKLAVQKLSAESDFAAFW